MEEIHKKGLAKSIGVSNFNSKQLTRLLESATIYPAVNQVRIKSCCLFPNKICNYFQIECHPYLNQKKLREFCSQRNIAIVAYSPLGSPQRPWQKPGDPDVINDFKIKEIAKKLNKTPAQVLLRYQIQLNTCPIPKSSNKKRLLENMNIFDFHLAPEVMAYINTFDCNGRVCPHDL